MALACGRSAVEHVRFGRGPAHGIPRWHVSGRQPHRHYTLQYQLGCQLSTPAASGRRAVRRLRSIRLLFRELSALFSRWSDRIRALSAAPERWSIAWRRAILSHERCCSLLFRWLAAGKISSFRVLPVVSMAAGLAL